MQHLFTLTTDCGDVKGASGFVLRDGLDRVARKREREGEATVNVVVTTQYGKVQGRESDGVATFLGIPYAASPEGSARFAPPRPPEPWRGVRDATECGPIAPQPESLLGGYVPGDPRIQAEDCLSINIFTPGVDGARRPVVVFIHGGAFLIGMGGGVMYRGDELARRGVVVVTFNYRLGALGFLAHPDLAVTPGAPFANWGMLDQIAALEFVRTGIDAFGGDPGNVTIFGESAGAMSAADLLAVPSARGLFRRAILQSGALATLSVDAASRNAERFVQALGLNAVDRDALCAVPADEVVAAQASLLGDLGVGASMPFQPVVDGMLFPRDPEETIVEEGSNAEAVIIGTNRDEFRFFTIGQRHLDDLSDEEIAPFVGAYLPPGRAPRAIEVIEEYRAATTRRGLSLSPRRIFESIAGDSVFWAPAVSLATALSRSATTYFYEFTWESPFMGGALGSCHGLELPFVFGTIANPIIGLFSGTGSDASALAEAIQTAWVAFATDGIPVSEPPWPEYEVTRRATLALGADLALTDSPRDREREIWESLRAENGRSATGLGDGDVAQRQRQGA